MRSTHWAANNHLPLYKRIQMIMNRTRYEIWLNSLQWKMAMNYIIKWDTILCPKSWKDYFDEGLKIKEVLIEEFGVEWMKGSIIDKADNRKKNCHKFITHPLDN